MEAGYFQKKSKSKPIQKRSYNLTKCILVLTLLSLCINQKSMGQEKFQINGFLAPSYEFLSTRDIRIDNPFVARYSYNFGGEIKYFLSPKMSTNIGLEFNNRGFKSIIDYEVKDDTVQTSVNISARYISVPISLCWNFTPIYRTELFFNVGATYGKLIGQSFRGKRIPSELGRPDNPVFEGVTNDKTNIKWFDGNYLGLTGGVGVSRYIKSRMVITVHPTVSLQVDRLLNPDGPIIPFAVTSEGQLIDYSPKLNSYGVLFKLGYYFSDQIENTKKTL